MFDVRLATDADRPEIEALIAEKLAARGEAA